MRPTRVAGEVLGGSDILAGADCQLSVIGEVILSARRVDRLFLCTRHVAFGIVPGSRGLPLSCKLR